MESTARTKPHIALITVPAFTHQVSILEFSKRLLHLHNNFHITCIIPTLNKNSPTKPYFDSLPQNINCIFLPLMPSDDITNNKDLTLESQIQLSVSHTVPSVRDTLRSLFNDTNVVALIVDAMVPRALDFGKELNILSYIYFPCSSMALSICLHSHFLDKLVSCEYKNHPHLFNIPGCIPIHGIDFPNSFLHRSSMDYKLSLQRTQRYHGDYDGILVNSFMELELETIEAISQQGSDNNVKKCPPLYPIGPVIQTMPSDQKLAGCESLLWLDKQTPNSVIYVSFGSGGTVSQDQINELALGLELSRHKFLWVNFRTPNDKANATYFSDAMVDDPLKYLPLGFLERTKEQGLVMCGWAPQVEVLGHKSIGAFLTHCGWNSILESVVHGVPMIAWPLFAEQKTNAALITNGLKVAMRPKVDTGGNSVVVKEEIVELIKSVMEGLESEEILKRLKELKKFAACAVMEDGSSTKTISKLAHKWLSLVKP